MEDLISQFNHHFYSDNFPEATELLSRIQSEFPEMELSIEMQKLQEDNYYIEQAHSLFHSGGWSLVKDKNNTTVEYKGGGQEFICKVTTFLESHIFPAISVIAEVQLLGNWVETAQHFLVLSEPTMFRKLVKYNIWFPFPFSNRDCYMECIAVPVKNEKAAIVILRSPHTDSYLGTHIQGLNNDKPKLEMHILIIHIQYIREDYTKFTLIVRANPHLAIIPDWLINLGFKTIMFQMMAKLRKQVQNYKGGVYEQAVNSKQEFYQRIYSLLMDTISES